MIIYGVALLAVCTLAGVIVGDFLGVLLGVKSNVGGVGIAMILLICARLYMHRNGGMSKECEFGVGFWGAMYIPWWWPWPPSRTWSPPCTAGRWRCWRQWVRYWCAVRPLP